MTTMHEHRDGIASIATALGDLAPDATINQRLAVADALTDRQVYERSARLLRALGYDDQDAA